MPRLFVCAWPAADIVALLDDLPRPALDGVRWVAPVTWHVTLRFIGDADIARVSDRLAAAELPRATLVLGPAVALLGDRHLVVPVAGAGELARAVRVATAGIGPTDQRRFHGHLTLARTDRRVAAPTVGTPIVGRFDVGHVALVTSELIPDGPRYSTVAVFGTT